MAAETDSSTDSGALISEKVAGGILPKVLTTFDMVAIFVAIVLFITNAAVIQSAWYTVTSINSADATLTSACVRKPAGRPWKVRSKPISPPISNAAAIRAITTKAEL